MKSPHSRYRALCLLYLSFQTTNIFYSPDDAIATSVARFGEETRQGGGVVFNVKWRRYALSCGEIYADDVLIKDRLYKAVSVTDIFEQLNHLSSQEKQQL